MALAIVSALGHPAIHSDSDADGLDRSQRRTVLRFPQTIQRRKKGKTIPALESGSRRSASASRRSWNRSWPTGREKDIQILGRRGRPERKGSWTLGCNFGSFVFPFTSFLSCFLPSCFRTFFFTPIVANLVAVVHFHPPYIITYTDSLSSPSVRCTGAMCVTCARSHTELYVCMRQHILCPVLLAAAAAAQAPCCMAKICNVG